MSGKNGKDEQFEDMAQDVAEDLRELRREFRQRANDVRKEVAKQLNQAAESIRREAREAKASDDVLRNADEVARGLEKTAHYLSTHSVEQMGKEATRVVRRYPMRAVLITFAVGFLMGLMFRGSDKK